MNDKNMSADQENALYADAEHQVPQGPPIRRKAKLSEPVPVRFPPELLAKVRDRAAADDRSVSNWIRRAVEHELEDPGVRTTVTLEPDVEAFINRAMADRGLSFKQAVNDAIRAGMTRRRGQPEPFATYDMGEPLVDFTKALRLAGELEDQELAARLARGA